MATNHGTSAAERGQGALLDDADFLRTLIERTLQQPLETEMTAHIGAEPYERTETRTGHRNGYRPRTLHTRVGTLTLLVPQDREGTFSTTLFARYQRSEKALVLALMEMYLEGVSTRKVEEITEALCGTIVDALKAEARRRGVRGYQTLVKQWIDERLAGERLVGSTQLGEVLEQLRSAERALARSIEEGEDGCC